MYCISGFDFCTLFNISSCSCSPLSWFLLILNVSDW
jgi:hypothetical protein